jgi:RNA polymerase sigma factor (sigma-70 family)
VTTPSGTGQPAARCPAAAARQDHDREIGEFFAANRDAVCRYLISAYGCCSADADDIVQDSILAVRAHWAKVRTYEKPAAYLYKVAGRMLLRRKGRKGPYESGGDSREFLLATPDPSNTIRAVDDRLAAMTLLHELPPRQRQVLWLRRAAEFTEAETAEILSIRPGTAKSTLHEAETRMQELLHKTRETWEARNR